MGPFDLGKTKIFESWEGHSWWTASGGTQSEVWKGMNGRTWAGMKRKERAGRSWSHVDVFCFVFFLNAKDLRIFYILKGNLSWKKEDWGYRICCCCLVANHVWLSETPWMAARQTPLSMGFSRQEYWSGLLCHPSEDLPDSGIEPAAPAWQENSLPLSHLGSQSFQIETLIFSLRCLRA